MTTSFRSGKPELRKYCTERVLDVLARRDVLHVDIWLRENREGGLYFLIETREGGFQLIRRGVLRLVPSALIGLDVVPVSEGELDMSGSVDRALNSAWGLARYEALNALHWGVIVPALRVPREGFKPYVSAKLHYVGLEPSALRDPCEGMANYSPWAKPAAPAPASQMVALGKLSGNVLDGDARSVFRTLDKLLGA